MGTSARSQKVLVDIDNLERLVHQISEAAHILARKYGISVEPPPPLVPVDGTGRRGTKPRGKLHAVKGGGDA